MTLVQKGFQTSTAESNHKPEHSDRVVSVHTPGPWVVDREAEGELWVSDAAREHPVCMVTAAGHISDVDEADARLIAAAPDLLEAVQELLATHPAAYREAGKIDNRTDNAVKIARTAIRLAQTGGAQP